MPITPQLRQLPFLWPWPYATLFPLYSCKTLQWSPLSEVHCFRMGPCNFSHCALWFLLSTASDTRYLFSPTLWFLFHHQVTMSFFTRHLSHFQAASVCFLSQHITGFERVLCRQPQSHANYLPSFKLFPRFPKNQMPHCQTTTCTDVTFSPSDFPLFPLCLHCTQHRAVLSCDHSSHEL